MKKKTDFSNKPYNRCIFCHHRTERRCDGARSSAMDLISWCEYMRDMKEANDLTNAFIAEESGVSIKTIERIMSLKSDQDIMRETARRIENAIIGSSNQYPCYLAFEESSPDNTQMLNEALRDLERALIDNADYRSVLDNIHASYNAEIQTIRDEALRDKQAIREEAQEKIDYLKEQVKRLREQNDHLWAENNRKSKLVDMFWERQKVTITEKKKEEDLQ